MDRKTMLKVFGEAFLRSMVVLMAIVIIGFGIFFVIRVNSDDKKVAEATTEQVTTLSDEELQAMLEEETEATTEEPTTEEITTEEVTTEEPTTEELNIPSTDKNIMILNGTNKSGLASSWMNKLKGEGFTNVAIGNYSGTAQAATRVMVAEEGMGKDLADYFADAELSIGAAENGTYVQRGGANLDHIDIFIIIGSNDTTVQ